MRLALCRGQPPPDCRQCPKMGASRRQVPLAAGLLDGSEGAALGRALADDHQMADRCFPRVPWLAYPPSPEAHANPNRLPHSCQKAAAGTRCCGIVAQAREPKAWPPCHPRPLKMGAGGFARVPTPPELFTGLPATPPLKWVSAPAPGPLTAGSAPKWEPVADRCPLQQGCWTAPTEPPWGGP